MEWVHAARSAVVAEAEAYQKLLRDENKEVSLSAAFLLGTLKRDLQWLASDLLETPAE